MLTPLIDGCIWTLERNLWFSGVRLRARTTVLRLADGGLLIHSPAPPTDELTAELRALGPVRWLVVPNCFHHLGAALAAPVFPEARVVGPASALKRSRGLRIDVELNAGQFVPGIETIHLDGVPFLDETLLYHRETHTLIGADVVIAADADDHFTWRWAARVTGCYQRLRVPPDVRKQIVDKAAAARSLRELYKYPSRRLLVAHAAIVTEDDCQRRLAEAWRLEGVDA